MSQCRSDLHILLYFSIYLPGIFTEIGGLIDINLGVKKYSHRLPLESDNVRIA